MQSAVDSGLLFPDKVVHIANGVDLEKYQAQPSSNSSKVFKIVFLGRLSRQKNPLQVIEIASALQKLEVSQPWEIYVYGDGELMEEMEERIRRFNLNEVIHMCGWVDSSLVCFEEADMILSTSLWEGVPLVLLEAMASELPVVCSDIEGSREAVGVDGGCGFLVGEQNSVEFANRIGGLINDPELAKRMGSVARRRVEQDFDSKQTYGKIRALYTDILNNG